MFFSQVCVFVFVQVAKEVSSVGSGSESLSSESEDPVSTKRETKVFTDNNKTLK